MQNTKGTPKSCSCRQCKYGKATDGGHFTRKKEERAFRHESKAKLNKGDLDAITPAPHGDFTD